MFLALNTSSPPVRICMPRWVNLAPPKVRVPTILQGLGTTIVAETAYYSPCHACKTSPSGLIEIASCYRLTEPLFVWSLFLADEHHPLFQSQAGHGESKYINATVADTKPLDCFQSFPRGVPCFMASSLFTAGLQLDVLPQMGELREVCGE